MSPLGHREAEVKCRPPDDIRRRHAPDPPSATGRGQLHPDRDRRHRPAVRCVAERTRPDPQVGDVTQPGGWRPLDTDRVRHVLTVGPRFHQPGGHEGGQPQCSGRTTGPGPRGRRRSMPPAGTGGRFATRRAARPGEPPVGRAAAPRDNRRSPRPPRRAPRRSRPARSAPAERPHRRTAGGPPDRGPPTARTGSEVPIRSPVPRPEARRGRSARYRGRGASRRDRAFSHRTLAACCDSCGARPGRPACAPGCWRCSSSSGCSC